MIRTNYRLALLSLLFVTLSGIMVLSSAYGQSPSPISSPSAIPTDQPLEMTEAVEIEQINIVIRVVDQNGVGLSGKRVHLYKKMGPSMYYRRMASPDGKLTGSNGYAHFYFPPASGDPTGVESGVAAVKPNNGKEFSLNRNKMWFNNKPHVFFDLGARSANVVLKPAPIVLTTR